MEKGVVFELISTDNDPVSFEVTVRFVVGKMETVLVSLDVYGGSVGHFMPVVEGFVVRERQFSQSHEGKETC